MAVFTIAVVILVWRTLVAPQYMATQPQEMAVGARTIGQAQTRAYLAVKNVSISGIEIGKNPVATFKVYNTGQTLAREVFGIFRLAMADGDGNRHNIWLSEAPSRSFAQVASQDGIAHDGTCEIPVAERVGKMLKAKGSTYVLAGKVFYRDVFGKRHRLVCRYFAAGGKDGWVMRRASRNNHSSYNLNHHSHSWCV